MLWVKAFHLIFVITWFAGIFTLPRLFIYHLEATDAVSIERYKLREARLLRIIMNPSAILATLLGLILLVNSWTAYVQQGWLWVKLTLVAALIAHHLYSIRIAAALRRDEHVHSERFFRVFNELPALVLIGVVIMVIVRPF